MTPKQQRFVAEYIKNGMNARQAAIAAGYSTKSAGNEGPRLLGHPEVKEAIAKRTQKAFAKIEFGIDRTLERVAQIAFFDVKDLFDDDGSLKSIKEIPPEARTVLAGLEVTELFAGAGEEKHACGVVKKVKLADRLRALDMLMRYHSLYKDKVEITVDSELAEALSRARKRTER